MAFENKINIDGDSNTYTISPEIKKYTLEDIGFIKNNNGSFTRNKALEANKTIKQSITLKVIVNAELNGIKIKTLDRSGNSKVNIFKMKNSSSIVELYEYYMKELIDRKVINK